MQRLPKLPEDVEIAVNHLADARRILKEHHDVVDTDSPLVQRGNWAMQATNDIDAALSEISAEYVVGLAKEHRRKPRPR